MKEYINLLPEKIKEEIRDDKKFRSLTGGMFGFLFPVVLLVGILFAINLILKVQEEGAAKSYGNEKSQVKYQDLKKYDEKFQSTNQKVGLILQVQDGHLAWAEILEKLSQTISEDITITGIANKDYRMFLVGRAKTREDLLALHAAISAEECFVGLNMPLSNLVSKEDADFQMDFEIKKDCLKNK